MSRLDLSPRLADPDALFAALAAAHAGLTEAQARQFDARLLLLLANHIGDETVLQQAIDEARGSAAARR
jgi:mannose-1-phosphate guanylyltransferase